MSKSINGIFGLVAAYFAFGVVQLASGSDLDSAGGAANRPSQNQLIDNVVNRGAKGDRASATKMVSGKTLSFQTESVSGTSILMRVPAIPPLETARNISTPRPAGRQAMLACEPVVSVLTAVAKRLPPSRCVT